MQQVIWDNIERARDLVLNFFLFGPINSVHPKARLAKALFYTRDPRIGIEPSMTTLPMRETWVGLLSVATGQATRIRGGKRLQSLINRCKIDEPRYEFLPNSAVLLLCVHGWLRGWSPVEHCRSTLNANLLVPMRPQVVRAYATCVEVTFYHVLVLVHGASWVQERYGSVDNWITTEVEGRQNTKWKHSRYDHTELCSGEWSNFVALLESNLSVRQALVELGMRNVTIQTGPGISWMVSFVHPLSLHVRIDSNRQHTSIYVQSYQDDDNDRTHLTILEWPATSTEDQQLTYLLTTHLHSMPVCSHTIFALGSTSLRRLVRNEPSIGCCMLLQCTSNTQSSYDAMHTVEAMTQTCSPLNDVDVDRYGVDSRISLEILHTGTVSNTERSRVNLARTAFPYPKNEWSAVINLMVVSQSLVLTPIEVLARRMFRTTRGCILYTASGSLFGGKRRFETLCLSNTPLLRHALVQDESSTHCLLFMFASLRKWQCPSQLQNFHLLLPPDSRIRYACTGDAWLDIFRRTLCSVVVNPSPLHRLLRRMFRTDSHRFYPAGGWLFGGRRSFESMCLEKCAILQSSLNDDQYYTHVLLYLYAGLRKWLRPLAIRDLVLKYPTRPFI